MKPEEKWNGTVIEVLNNEHGKKVIEWWKEQGVSTTKYGHCGSNDGYDYCYYGIIEGCFDNYTKETIGSYKAKIITLPEPFPEQWYMICTKENREVANEWRKSVAKTYLYTCPYIGEIFISEPFEDNSYYLAGGHEQIRKNYRHLTQISFDQFKENVLKQPKQSNKMKIKTEQAQEIIDMVSPSCKWKERLLDLWAKSIVLKQEIEVSDELYKEGYKDASESQKKVLDGIFGKSKEVDITERPVDCFLMPRTDGDYKDKSFYLDESYNWEIKKDNEGELCLIPTNK